MICLFDPRLLVSVPKYGISRIRIRFPNNSAYPYFSSGIRWLKVYTRREWRWPRVRARIFFPRKTNPSSSHRFFGIKIWYVSLPVSKLGVLNFRCGKLCDILLSSPSNRLTILDAQTNAPIACFANNCGIYALYRYHSIMYNIMLLAKRAIVTFDWTPKMVNRFDGLVEDNCDRVGHNGNLGNKIF